MNEDDVFGLLTEIDESGSSTKAEHFQALAEQLTQGEYGRATFRRGGAALPDAPGVRRRSTVL